VSLSVLWDHPQVRLSADRLTVVAAGQEWDGSIRSNTWIDPITETLMLQPTWLTPQWMTSSTGLHAKMSLAEFGTPSAWEERADQHWAGPWLALKDSGASGSLVSQTQFAPNRGMVVSWFGYGAGDRFRQLSFGWGSGPNASTGVGLEFWTDGTVEVYRDGEWIATGKITGAKARDVRRFQTFQVLILPMRGRELLVLSQSGDGFVVVFNQIAADDLSPVITPAGSVWLKAESGAIQVQIAPVKFPSSGFATSLKTSFLEPPATGELPEQFSNASWLPSPAPFLIQGWPGFGAGVQSAAVSLVGWDGSTPFTPNGSDLEVRLRAELSSTHEGYTPFLSAGQAGFPAQRAATAGTSGHEVVDQTSWLEFSCPVHPWGVAADLAIWNPQSLEVLAPGALSASHRPVRLSLGNQVLMEASVAKVEQIVAISPEAESVHVELRDRWRALETAVFSERMPLDGMSLGQAIRQLVLRSGLPETRIRMSALPMVLPQKPGAVSGDWNLLIEVGDTAAEWIRRLAETFAMGAEYGFRPRPDGSGEEFLFLLPSDLPTGPALTLYLREQDAVAANAPRSQVITAMESATIPPQANEVRVTGWDPRVERPIQSMMVDRASQNVGLPVAQRPESWVGEIRRTAIVDPALTSEAAVDAACRSLFAALSQPKKMVQISCGWLTHPSGAPIWKGDCVAIHGKGIYRIASFACRFEHEATGLREATYTAIEVAA
jgi:hypothetical protein